VGRPSKEPPIANTLVPALLRWTGVAVADNELALPLNEIEDKLEGIAIERGEPELGLLLPTRLSFPRYGYGELAARASTDVHAAMERLARYAPLAVPGAVGTCEGRSFRVRFPPRARRPSRVLHEWALAHALATLRAESEVFLLPERVWFVHARPRELGPLHLFFGTHELDFGREDDGFELSAADVARPLRARDERLAATMDELAARAVDRHTQPLSYAERVERAIKFPDAGIESVASALHASPRTLQRRLEAEGTRYSEVLDRARATLARKLLRESTLPIAEIAARVGFSDVAPFTRAFRRWTGTPPGAFRRNDEQT